MVRVVAVVVVVEVVHMMMWWFVVVVTAGFCGLSGFVVGNSITCHSADAEIVLYILSTHSVVISISVCECGNYINVWEHSE